MIDIISDPVGAPPQPDNVVKPHAVFLLDESGSMNPYRTEVVSTFNKYVSDVRGTAKTVSLYTFDSTGIREKIYLIPPERVKQLSEADYEPGAMTPLYDAMGVVINKFIHETRPVQFFTHTDGQENHSKEWTKAALDELIAHQKQHRNWLFTYLMEGIEGRRALETFDGLKVAFSPGMRGQAMNMVASSTSMYASTMDSNAGSYTLTGTDEIDVDAGDKLRSGTAAPAPSQETTGGNA